MQRCILAFCALFFATYSVADDLNFKASGGTWEASIQEVQGFEDRVILTGPKLVFSSPVLDGQSEFALGLDQDGCEFICEHFGYHGFFTRTGSATFPGSHHVEIYKNAAGEKRFEFEKNDSSNYYNVVICKK